LVDHHLDAVVACGIRRIAIVVGYRADEYRAAVGSSHQGVPIQYVVNENYEEHGQVHSLYLGRHLFDGPTLLINADVYGPASFYRQLLDTAHDNLMLLDPDYPVLTGDEVIICGADGRVTGLALGFPPDARGEFIGLNKFGPAFLASWCAYIERTFDDLWKGANYEWVLDRYLRETGADVRYAAVGTRDWVNVNYADDLVTAHEIARRVGRSPAPGASPARVGAGVAVMDAGRLLLVQRGIAPERGKWSVPGGLLEDGEDPRAAAIRETREETGLEVSVERFVGAFVDETADEAVIFLLFQGQPTGGAVRAGCDAERVAFFRRDELPALAFASTMHAVDQLLAAPIPPELP
jgi:acetyl-CoA carboxylase carboxyl transferase subunit beta